MLILKLLASYLTLGADPPEKPDPDPAEKAESDPPDDDLPDLEADDEPAPKVEEEEADPQVQIKAAKDRADKYEREAADLRARAEAAERRSLPAPGPSDEQKLFEAEEAQLRDPNATESTRWTINSNRTLRQSARASEQALRTSRDLSDKAAYDRMAMDKPIAKKYAERVEKKLAEIRAGGGDPQGTVQRTFILKALIGDDYVEGRVKSKPKTEPKVVERGKPPVTRGDVRGKEAASEHAKRMARLEGQNI
jgi:hypothetical protein